MHVSRLTSHMKLRLCFVLTATLIILVVQGVVAGNNDSAYVVKAMPTSNYCGTAQAHHCYGVQRWYGSWGSQTAITIVPLTCNLSGGGCDFIDNEMWLEQTNDSQCPTEQDTCWVEVGYYNDPFDGHTESYFWADSRPGSTLLEHFIADVPVGDYNVPATFQISQTCGADCWNVAIYATKEYYNEQSTSNSMNPTGQNSLIQIGMELAGSTSNAASSNPAYFTQNAWYSTTAGTFNYQTNTGLGIIPWAPPWMRQVTAPAPGNGGGTYLTSCCTHEAISAPPSQGDPGIRSSTHVTTLGIPALTPRVRQSNGATFDSTSVSSYVLSHPMPRMLRQEKTAVQKIVYAKSQDISRLLNGESLEVPDGTLLCYVQMSGTFVFPSPPGTPDVVSHQAVEVFDATTGNLVLAGE